MDGYIMTATVNVITQKIKLVPLLLKFHNPIIKYYLIILECDPTNLKFDNTNTTNIICREYTSAECNTKGLYYNDKAVKNKCAEPTE